MTPVGLCVPKIFDAYFALLSANSLFCALERIGFTSATCRNASDQALHESVLTDSCSGRSHSTLT